MSRIIKTDVGSFLEEYTQERLIEIALEAVTNNVDKREGSIIYDSVAAACEVVSDFVHELRNAYRNTYAGTAMGDALVMRTSEMGVYPEGATNAVRLGTFLKSNGEPFTSLSAGDEFSTIATDQRPAVIFVVSGFYTEEGVPIPGKYLMTCKEPGIIGNEYIGEILPLSNYIDLAYSDLTDILITASDAEGDESLRTRYYERLDNKSFGGNIHQYREEVIKFAGVGALQVYPTWNGGNTVKISVVDNNYMPVSNLLLEQLKEAIDPTDFEGDGLGLAPIGHKVTMDTPELFEITVEADVAPIVNVSVNSIREAIIQSIENYIKSIRETEWGVPDQFNRHRSNVYLARVSSAILLTPGVANVTNVKLNGVEGDILLIQTAVLQQQPILVEVILNEL